MRYTDLGSYPVWSAGLAAGATYTLKQTAVSDPELFEQGAEWSVTVSEYGDTVTVASRNDAAYGSFDTTLQVNGEAEAVTALQDRYLDEINVSLEKEWEDILGNATDAPEDIAGVRLACAWSKDGAEWFEAEIDLTADEDYAGTFSMPGAAQMFRVHETAYILVDGSTVTAVEGWQDVINAGAWYVQDGVRKEGEGLLKVTTAGLTEVHLTNRSTESSDGYTVQLEKVWELTDENAEPPVQSVTLTFQPFARGTSLDNLTKLGDDESPDSVTVELYASRNWKGAVTLEKDIAYLVTEEKDESLEDSFATEFTTEKLGSGETQTSWTLSVKDEEGTSTLSFNGTDMAVVWPGLAEEEEGGLLSVNNSERVFRVVLDWDDWSNAWSTRPEHVTLTLEENAAETSREGEGWTPVTDITGSGVEHPLENQAWVKDSYTYSFDHVDLSKFYQVSVSGADSDTEQLLDKYTVIYEDSRNADEHTQNITLVYRPTYTVTVEWMDAENKDDLRPDSLTVELMCQVTDSDTGETTLEAATDENGNPVTLVLTRPDENENVGGVGYWQGSFPLAMMDQNTVYVARVVGAENGDDIISFDDAGTYGVTYYDMQLPVTSEADFSQRIVLTAKREYQVEKTWNVDLAQKDVPEELGVILQKKEGTQVKDGETVDKWSDPVQRLTLNADNGWKGTFNAVDRYTVESDVTELKDGKTVRTVTWSDGDTYRVREISDAKLRETLQSYLDGATGDLPLVVQSYIAEHKPVDSILDWAYEAVDGSDVPEAVKKWTKGYLQDNIPEDGEDITLQVKTDDGTHSTKYQVKYEVDGDKVSITNTAILDITIYKKWLMFGSAEDDIPDSVYLMLMSRAIYPEDMKEMADQIPYSNVYLPVTSLGVVGGTLVPGDHSDYITFGIPLDFIAIAEAKKPEEGEDDSKGWQVSFRVKKYNDYGLEQEFKGGELVSASLSTIAGIVADTFGFDGLADILNYVSINPGGYISVSTKAMAIPEDYIPVVGDDTHLLSVVVNTWSGEYKGIGGVKYWKDDSNAYGTRPESVSLSVYETTLAGDVKLGETVCSPDTLWTWTFSTYTDPLTGEEKHLDEDKIALGVYKVKEDDVPAGYTVSYDGYDVINTLTALTVENTVYNSGEGNDPEFTYTLALTGTSATTLKALATRRGSTTPVEETLTASAAIPGEAVFTFTLKNDEQLTILSAADSAGSAIELPELTYTLTQTAPGDGWTTDVAASGQDTQKDTAKVEGTLQGGTDIHWYNSLPITVSGNKTVQGKPLSWYFYSRYWRFDFSMQVKDARSGSFDAICTGSSKDTFSFSFTPNDWSDLPQSVTVKETAAYAVDENTGEKYEVFLPVDTEVPLTAVRDENGILQVTAETLTIDNEPKPISVTVIKQWREQEGEDLPDSLGVTFYAAYKSSQVMAAQKVLLSG